MCVAGWAAVGRSRKNTEEALVPGKGRRDGEMAVEGELRVDPAGVWETRWAERDGGLDIG